MIGHDDPERVAGNKLAQNTRLDGQQAVSGI